MNPQYTKGQRSEEVDSEAVILVPKARGNPRLGRGNHGSILDG